MGTGVDDPDLVRHEYAHAVHLAHIGPLDYALKVAMPSAISFHSNPDNSDYYSQPWEYIADMLGGADKPNSTYLPNAAKEGAFYYLFTLF